MTTLLARRRLLRSAVAAPVAAHTPGGGTVGTGIIPTPIVEQMQYGQSTLLSPAFLFTGNQDDRYLSRVSGQVTFTAAVVNVNLNVYLLPPGVAPNTNPSYGQLAALNSLIASVPMVANDQSGVTYMAVWEPQNPMPLPARWQIGVAFSDHTSANFSARLESRYA